MHRLGVDLKTFVSAARFTAMVLPLRVLWVAGATLWLAVAAVVPVVAAEQAGPDPAMTAEVRRLVEELNSPERAVRAAAEQRLLDLGPQVLLHLPPPELLPTNSVRAAVDRIRHPLERRQARESLEPSRVALSGRESLETWLDEISRQSGNRCTAADLSPELRERPVSLERQRNDFWPTLESLAHEAGLVLAPDRVRRGVVLQMRNEEHPDPSSVAYAGPFRLSAGRIESKPLAQPRRNPLDQRGPRKVLRIPLSVWPEPRLRPLFLQVAAADIEARWPGGEALAPFSPEANYELPVGDGAVASVPLQYVMYENPQAENTRQRELHLRGKLHMTLAAATTAIRFIDLSEQADGRALDIARRRGGVTVTLERVRREKGAEGGQELRVRVTVAYDVGGPAFESHRTWILNNEVYLETREGTRVNLNGGFETTMQANGAAGMEYRFVDLPDPLPDYAFVYVAPSLIVDAPIEFELKVTPP